MVRGFNYLDQDVATTFRIRSCSSENEKLLMTSDIGAITRQRHPLIGCAFLEALMLINLLQSIPYFTTVLRTNRYLVLIYDSLFSIILPKHP